MKKLLFTLLLIFLVACSKQAPIETQETKLDISDELDKITENIEDLDFNENLNNISQEFEEVEESIENITEIKLEVEPELEKISVPATINEDFKDKLIRKQFEESNKTFDIITKTGNIIKLILPDRDPNGIKITYVFNHPFNKDGIFEAQKGEFKTKVTAIAQDTKIEKEFTVLII